MAQELDSLLPLILLCLVLIGTSIGLMIGAFINNNKYKHIMDTQQEIIDALNLAKETIATQTAKLATINGIVLKIGTETDGLKEAVRVLTEALNNNAPLQALKDAAAGVVAAVTTQSEAIAALDTSAVAGDAKVDDAPSA